MSEAIFPRKRKSILELMDSSSVTPSEVILTCVLIAALLLGLAGLFTQGIGVLLSAGMAWKFHWIALLMGFACYLELLSWFSAVKYIGVSQGALITAPAPTEKSDEQPVQNSARDRHTDSGAPWQIYFVAVGQKNLNW
jgi:hypothetical protein